MHSAIGPPETATRTRPEVTPQASNARFVMILRGPVEPALLLWAVARNAFRLNATVLAQQPQPHLDNKINDHLEDQHPRAESHTCHSRE